MPAYCSGHCTARDGSTIPRFYQRTALSGTHPDSQSDPRRLTQASSCRSRGRGFCGPKHEPRPPLSPKIGVSGAETNQGPAQAANTRVFAVACDPKARPAVRALAIVRDVRFRCRQATDVAASADPRRHQRRVFAGQLPLAGWAAQISAAAIDGADTVMPHSVRRRVSCRYTALPTNRAHAASSSAILLDLIQMPGTEPDQSHHGATAFHCRDDPQHLIHLALAHVDGHPSHPDGRFRRAVPVNPPGPVMRVRNQEVPCNPIPGADITGFRFTRNQNGVIVARCMTCHIGFVVREANAEMARFTMSAHQDLHGSHLRRGAPRASITAGKRSMKLTLEVLSEASAAAAVLWFMSAPGQVAKARPREGWLGT